MTPRPWAVDRLDDLARLSAAALPAEPLMADELEPCWRPSGVILGTDDGAVVAGVDAGRPEIGVVDLLVVDPAAGRSGLGRRLLDAAVEWLADTHGVTRVVLAGSVPWYLWPGVDASATAMLGLAEAAGFTQFEPARLNLWVSTGHRAPAPDGVTIRRVLTDDDRAAALAMVSVHYPNWLDEVSRGIDAATTHASWVRDRVVGIGAHSVNRLGWIGPMATDPGAQGTGHGGALLGAVCEDLAVAGYREAEIAWIGPLRFYEKVAGARAGRVFLVLGKRL